MKSIFNLLWFSVIAQSVAAQGARPLADTCLPHYRLSRAEVTNCQIHKNEQSPFLIEMTMLGKSLADGFRFNWNPNQMNGHFSTTLFAYNGTTTPLAGVFQPCLGNWLYFKGRGFRKSVQNANTVEQYQDVSFRVRYWGDIRNPDSLKLEYKSETVSGAYVTTRRDSVCNYCLATDKIPPQIKSCPNGIVELPMPADPSKVNGNDVMKQVGIKVTDNCGIYNATNYPYWTSVMNGQVIDYKTVVYDASGNRSVCQFKVKWGTRIPPLADTCQIRFQLSYRETQTCDGATSLTKPNLSVTLLGNKIADGFKFTGGRSGNVNYLVGKNGQKTQPTGTQYNTCAGNWTYFTATGAFTGTRPPTGTELTNVQVRIKHFGNERNPDSLRLEFAKNNTFETGMLYNSFQKDTICSPCLITDKTAPKIINCPTQLVNYPITNDLNVFSSEVMKFAKIGATDDCELSNLTTFPYRLTGFQIGQTVDYHTVAYDAAGNRSVCQFKTQFLSPSNDTCLAYFTMESRSTPTCDDATVSVQSRDSKSIRLLGKRIADGIEIKSSWMNPIGSARSSSQLFGKNGSTTPPVGSQFSACPGNWTYFIASGWSFSWTIHNTTKTESPNVYVRVKHFGNESNPDSLRIEYSGGGFFNTTLKGNYCNRCAATDKIAPVIQHCPTQIVLYPAANRIAGDSVANYAFTVTDNCQLEDVSTYPYEVRSVKNGQIIDFHTVAYDKTGNKSVCQFKAQMIVPVPAPAKLIENQSVAFEIQGINPNPTDGALTVTLESNVEKEVNFEFYNSLGEKAHSVTKPVQKGENSLFFDVTKLANGIYFIQTSEQGEKIHLTKFVKH